MGLGEFAVNFFIALIALLDPIGNVPVFGAATGNATGKGRRTLATYLCLFLFAFLTFFFFTGLGLLQFFGISLAAFRIAGGILLLLLGLEMVREDFTAAFADPSEGGADHRAYAKRGFERLVVPFGMPLLIGPGAISAVIIYAGEAADYGLRGFAVGLGVLAAVSATILLALWSTGPISRILGKVGVALVVRVLGLVLCALAIQFIIIGMGEATTGLINAEAANPYDH
ncbi:MAG: MarC family protein [Pseudomonadota bacterium]|nr:MarC family protein [Pseudomonadota bacterium]